MQQPASIWEQIFTRKMLICIFTGFTSGMPLFVIYQLIPYWLKDEGVGLKEIGFFALVGIPYAWKFIWSPFMDNYPLPFLGHRRGWLLITQVALLCSISGIGFLSPDKSIWLIAYLAAAMAFFSASQDIELDAYRRELLDDDELGSGNSIHIQAYRISGLIPGALGPALSDHISWQAIFVIVGAFMLVGVLLTLFIKDLTSTDVQDRNLNESVILPFKEFMQRNGWQSAVAILAFMFLYKLGDSMATALSYPFFYEIGFTGTEIGTIAKSSGLIAAIVGGFLAIPFLSRYGINRCLWYFGVVQITSILGFALLAYVGNDKVVLAGVMIFEYLGVGLGTAAFTAFIARNTNPAFAATQFALLTALTALPRTFANASAGIIIEQIGWFDFFILCTVLALPGMLMLRWVAPFNGESKANDS